MLLHKHCSSIHFRCKTVLLAFTVSVTVMLLLTDTGRYEYCQKNKWKSTADIHIDTAYKKYHRYYWQQYQYCDVNNTGAMPSCKWCVAYALGICWRYLWLTETVQSFNNFINRWPRKKWTVLNVKTVKSIVTKILVLVSAILIAEALLWVLTIVFTSIVNILHNTQSSHLL